LVGMLLSAFTPRAGSQEVPCPVEKSGFDALDAQFKNPPNEYRLVQYMGHGSAVVPVNKMRAYGIGGVKLFMGSHEYLRSAAGWEQMESNIRLAKEGELQVWLGDDNGFPSGMAGGLVVEEDPAFEVRGLFQVAIEGEGFRKVQMDLPSGAEAFVHAVVYPIRNGSMDLAAGAPARVVDGCVEAQGLDGPWLLTAFAPKVIGEGTQAAQTAQGFQTNGRYPNLLNAAAMKTFVELTHAEYARRLEPLSEMLDVIYTNEPNLMTLYFEQGSRPGGEAFVPWDAALPARFREKHGYDLMPYLAALFSGDSDHAKLVRRHFYQTVGDMLAANYSGRIAGWAAGHGIRSGGHLLLEEYMAMHVICYGDFLRVLMEQHVPGCDIPMPDLGAPWNYWMPKYISSAAYLRGRETVSALLDPIIGRVRPMLMPTPDDFRRIVNMAYLTGANQITTYIRWESYEPEIYRSFNEYVGRLALMLRGAVNATNLCMYYPIETFQAAYKPSPEFWSSIAWGWRDLQRSQNEVARSLLEHGYDFNYVDAAAILSAQIDQGRLAIGAHAYRMVIMPQVDLVPLDVLRKLQAFEKAGGTLLWVDALPRLGDAPEEHGQVREAVAEYELITPSEVVARAAPAFPESFKLAFEGPPEDFFTARLVRDGRRLYFIVNNSADPATPRISGREAAIRVYDPIKGTVSVQGLPGAVAMSPFSSLIVVEEP
jgi:hypothetical protein